MNASYVIATSTSVDVSKVDVSKFEDKYFKAVEKKTTKKGESEFFESEPEKKVSGLSSPSLNLLWSALPSNSHHKRS